MLTWIANNKLLTLVFGLILVIVVVAVRRSESTKSLADCIAKSGAKFYGTKTCGYCKKQKEMFGDDVAKLPYVECAKVGGGVEDVCRDNKIAGYPTWIFADGSRQQGAISLDVLAAKTKCSLK